MSPQPAAIAPADGARASAARWRPATACSCACIRPGGLLTADGRVSIADAAREFGNGHLDITVRGNLQIRGVRDETHPTCSARLDGTAWSSRRAMARTALPSLLRWPVSTVSSSSIRSPSRSDRRSRASHPDGSARQDLRRRRRRRAASPSMRLAPIFILSATRADCRHRFRRAAKGLALDRRNQSCLRRRKPFSLSLRTSRR